MWLFLMYLVAIPVVTIPVLLALYVVWYNIYWYRRGLPALPALLFWKYYIHSIFVTKSNGDADIALYKQFSGKRFVGICDVAGPNLWVMDPELMKNIFVKDFDHFSDRFNFDLGEKMEYLNLMMTNLSGKLWKDVRSVVSPTFTSGKMKRIFPSVCHVTDQLKEYFDGIADKGQEVEMKDAYGRFTMDVITSTAFGVKCNSFTGRGETITKMASKLVFPNASVFVVVMLSIMWPQLIRFLTRMNVPLPSSEEALTFFANLAKDTIAEREKSGVKGNDFLQLLLDARKGELDDDDKSASTSTGHKDTSKSVLNEPLLIAQCIIFFIAGYDTASNTLGFAAYELALNPELQERLYEEVKEVVDKHKGQVTYDAIMEMELLDRVIHESLRLHSPGFRMLRLCTKDYQIPETNKVIQKGSLVCFPMFAIQRDERYYPNPTKFDPERFTQGEKAKRNPYVFQAFGHGPRSCVGMRFALMETKAALASTILNFRFQPSERTEIPMLYTHASFFSQAKNGVWLKLEKRHY